MLTSIQLKASIVQGVSAIGLDSLVDAGKCPRARMATILKT